MTGERTFRDILAPFGQFFGRTFDVDIDQVYDRRCQACEWRSRPAALCVICHGTGREVVHVIVAVTPDDLTAMRIGRAVLGHAPPGVMWAVEYHRWLLAGENQ